MLIQDIIPPVKKVIKPVGKIIKKQSRNKYVSMFLAFLLVFETFGGVFIPFKLSLKSPYIFREETKAVGEGWITGGTWNYRRAITLSPATPVANYQVKVTLSGAVLTGAQLTSSNANGNDVRFTGSNGTTEQKYWIESWSAAGTTVTATIWVNVITSGESTIYMYYGNSTATTAIDGANTFDFFDDFDGTSLDSKWSSIGTPTVAVAGSVLTVSSSGWSNDRYIKTASYTANQNVAMRVNLKENALGNKYPGDIGWGTYHGGSDNTLQKGIQTTAQFRLATKSGTNTTGAGATSMSTTYKTYDLTWLSSKAELSENGAALGNVTTYIPNASLPIVIGAPENGGGSWGWSTSITWILVRKYNSSEPSATVGSEEYFNHYAITGTGTMNAGGSQVITITAKTNLGNTYSFSGDKSLTFSGPGISGGGNNPTCTDKTSADINFGTATTVTLASGVGTCIMKLYKVESVSVDATDGTISSAGDAAYDLDVVVDSPMVIASMQINNGDAYTAAATITINSSVANASQLKASLDGITYSSYVAYADSVSGNVTNPLIGGNSAEGLKTVYVIYKDVYGNESAVLNDNITYDITPPTNPAAAVDAQGAVTDTWQNNKSDPNFTSFTGEFDTNGIASYYVYFGTSSTGIVANSIATDAYDPDPFAVSGIRYLRVIAKDNAGLWADPDGAGTTCTNTNAARPADADCWTTIFIHKYDIDAPSDPSPVSSPVSWTNTNSFDFSWSDPGDTGGSGVKDYTYQTDAGTGATTTVSTSISGLISGTDGRKLFSVKANDNAGNSGADGTVNFYYDSIPPTNAGIVTDGNGSLDDTWGVVSDPSFTWVVGTDAGDQSGVKEYDVYWGTDSAGTAVAATVAVNAYDPGPIPANTPYYLRIKTRDNAGNESAWATKFTMKYSQAASTPSGLSQTANAASLAFGEWTSDAVPILKFTLSDPDSDALGYVIKIDNNSNFSSPEVFYTYSANDLPSGIEYSFTVGQAAGSGIYSSGIEGQALTEGTYYWKVKAIESHGLASSENTANGGFIAFGVDTSSPVGTALGFGTIAADSIVATVSGASDASSGLHATPYYFENATADANSGWQAETSWSSTALSPNTQYTFKVKSRDAASNESAYTATQNKYTLANAPAAPTVNNAMPAALDVNVNVNSNPASTEFAIYKESGAICDVVGGSYVAANGSDNGATAVWQTDAQWGTTSVTGLLENTQYSFCAKARNGDGAETSFGSAVSGTTTISNQAPNAPILVSPADGSYTSDNTPTLSANYSDPDTGDIGTTNYRVSSTNTADCNNNLNIVASGVSSATLINNEDTVWTFGSSIGSDGTYYWCAQNDDGSLTSSWSSMGNFILDIASPIGTTLGFGTIAADSITATVSGASDASSGLHATPYYFENATAAANSGWQAETSWSSTALSPNTQYTFKVKSRDSLNNESGFTAAQSKYTLANTPSSLDLTVDSQAQVTASWNANSNPDGTEYYIENTTIGTNSGWITNTAWSSNGLSCGISYSFKVKAKNTDGVETDFTSTQSIITQICHRTYVPPNPVSSSTPVPTPIPNITPFPTSTPIFTLTPTPVPIFSPIPEPSLTPMPTLTPSPFPAITPFPTLKPVITPSPFLTPTPIPSPKKLMPTILPAPSPIKFPVNSPFVFPLPGATPLPSESPLGQIPEATPKVQVSGSPKPSLPTVYEKHFEFPQMPEIHFPKLPKLPSLPKLPVVDLGYAKKGISLQYKKIVSGAVIFSSSIETLPDLLFKPVINNIGKAGLGIAGVPVAGANLAGAIFHKTKTTALSLSDSVKSGAVFFGNGIGNTFMEIKTIAFEYTTPMEILNLKAVPLSSTSVEITWDTNHRGTSKVNWGLSRVYDQEKQDSLKVNKHSVILTDLRPGTIYHYEAISQNGSYAYDADRVFYTPAE